MQHRRRSRGHGGQGAQSARRVQSAHRIPGVVAAALVGGAVLLGGVVFLASAGVAAAQAGCDLNHEVQAGDTYYSISETYYGSRREWQTLYQANLTATRQPSLIPGNTLYVPCLDGGVAVSDVQTTAASSAQPEAPQGQPPQQAPGLAAVPPAPKLAPAPEPVPEPARVYPENPDLTLVTGGDYAPFTGPGLPQQGLATELVHALMDIAPGALSYAVTWNDAWTEDLDPLVQTQVDMGFPWVKPNCAEDPLHAHCRAFHFSDPLMEMPIMLFVREDTQFRFRSDRDVLGRSICRPEGYFTHDLDRADRRWISEGKITFVTAPSPEACFQKVLDGAADAASVNLFLGASVILEMGLRNQIVPLERPVSEEGLHVVVSKSHWRGTALLYRVNAGLARLKESGAYRDIVSRHLGRFQSRLQ